MSENITLQGSKNENHNFAHLADVSWPLGTNSMDGDHFYSMHFEKEANQVHVVPPTDQ